MSTVMVIKTTFLFLLIKAKSFMVIITKPKRLIWRGVLLSICLTLGLTSDMRQRALFVTSNAACRWNKMFFAELSEGISRAVGAADTEHRPRWASGCHPLSVESGKGYNCTLLPASWTISAYFETFPAIIVCRESPLFVPWFCTEVER